MKQVNNEWGDIFAQILGRSFAHDLYDILDHINVDQEPLVFRDGILVHPSIHIFTDLEKIRIQTAQLLFFGMMSDPKNNCEPMVGRAFRNAA